MAVLVSLDLILVGPVYLVGLAGLSGLIGNSFRPHRVLRIIGLVVAGAVMILMFSIGLLGHLILGLSILGIGAALAISHHDGLWLRIAASGIGFVFGYAPISTVRQASIDGSFKMVLLILAVATLVISLMVLVPALMVVLLKRDALAIALLVTGFSLAASGMLGLASTGASGMTQDSQELEGSAAFYVMAFDLLGTRAKDIVMSVALPIILGIWGLIRLLAHRDSARVGNEREESQSGTWALQVATVIALAVQILNAVIFNVIGIHNPLNFAAPLFEFVALVLWLIAVIIAWRNFAYVRINHLPGNTLDVRSRITIGVLLLGPAAIALAEFIVNVMAMFASESFSAS
ncbi:hypothetical protein [Microbacterium sp. A93]|uniref:hypothetical protein n=1 Tax=Microbacterium sp. A93 TaxID=3450716 RepID=UPI003F440878